MIIWACRRIPVANILCDIPLSRTCEKGCIFGRFDDNVIGNNFYVTFVVCCQRIQMRCNVIPWWPILCRINNLMLISRFMYYHAISIGVLYCNKTRLGVTWFLSINPIPCHRNTFKAHSDFLFQITFFITLFLVTQSFIVMRQTNLLSCLGF